MANFRVTFRKRDKLGGADFVRDMPAEDGCRAIQQVAWQLKLDHPTDDLTYEFQMCVRVERTDPAEGVPA